MSPSDLYFNIYLTVYCIIGVAVVPHCHCRISADIAIIDDNGDWVLIDSRHHGSVQEYGAISKRMYPRNAVNSLQSDLLGNPHTGSSKNYKYPLIHYQNDQRHRNRNSANGGQARQACPTTPPVPMKLLYGISNVMLTMFPILIMIQVILRSSDIVGRVALASDAVAHVAIIYDVAGKNGSEVEIQPGQIFMLIECDKVDRPPCYGFSHDRLFSWCETSHTAQYAFMRLKGTNLPWSLDHIMVPSGCLCYISERPAMSSDEEWQIEK